MSTHNIPLIAKYPGTIYRCHDGGLDEVTNDHRQMDMTEEEANDQDEGRVDYSERQTL